MDINRLRRITEIVALRLQKELSRNGNTEESKADQAIIQIVILAEAAAKAGRNKAVIMEITKDDYGRSDRCLFPAWNWRVCKPEWLTGACKLVFEYCQEAGLDPRIEYWHEDIGMKNEGFYIVIRW